MQRYCAEFLGTFALLFTGAGAIVIDRVSGGAVTHVGIALTFGLVVLAIVYALGDVSGAHINPAVTIGFWFCGRFPTGRVVPYIVSQMLGAVVACGLLRLLFGNMARLGSTVPSGSMEQSLGLEIVLTWFLMFVVLCVATGAKEKGIMAGVAVGAVVALEAMFAGPISGASMNPARSLGPALVSLTWTHQWIYVVGPLVGSAVAVITFRLVENAPPAGDDEEPVAEEVP